MLATIGIVLEAALKYRTMRDVFVTITSGFCANHFLGEFCIMCGNAPSTMAGHSKIAPFVHNPDGAAPRRIPDKTDRCQMRMLEWQD